MRPRRDVTWVVVMTAIIAVGFLACSDQGPVDNALAVGSFAQLERTVFQPSCATSGCHVAASASQSGNLILTPDVAYTNLVGASPTNLNAKSDGLRRVVKGKPDSSLLYQKIVLALNAHGGAYGGTMPVGNTSITIGQVEFVRKWIESGAPDSGFVADSSLLADKTPQASAAFTPLAAPAAGAGYQVKVDAFTVKPNFERELFEYRPLGNAQKIYVNRIQTSMRPFSHHFLLYTATPGPFCPPPADVVRDIRNNDGTMNITNMLAMSCHVFLGGSMVQQGDYVFPTGVALELPAGTSIDMNVHYANKTQAVVPGEAYANLYTAPLAAVTKVAHVLNMSNQTFVIAAHTDSSTATKTFTVSQTTTIFALTSHMHARGTRFEIKIAGGTRSGESVYVNTDWEHPQMLMLSTPIVLQPGEGLTSIVTWHNDSDQIVTFGLLSTDEMAIIFGYWY